MPLPRGLTRGARTPARSVPTRVHAWLPTTVTRSDVITKANDRQAGAPPDPIRRPASQPANLRRSPSLREMPPGPVDKPIAQPPCECTLRNSPTPESGQLPPKPQANQKTKLHLRILTQSERTPRPHRQPGRCNGTPAGVGLRRR